MKNLFKVIVVGAGIAGLSAARELEKSGANVLIVDSSDKIGGRVRSDSVDGFILDRGFQVLPSSYKRTLELVGDLKFLSYHSGAKIWDGSKFLAIYNPLRHPTKLWETIRSGIFNLSDYIKLLLFVLKLNARTEEISTYDSISRLGFSQRSIKLFFKPFLSGIFLENKLETSSSFFKFAIQKFLFGKAQLPQGGIEAIPKAIASMLMHSEIRLNTKVERILEDGILLSDGSIERSEIIIVATDAETTEKLFNLPGQTKWNSTTICYFSSNEAPFSDPILILNAADLGILNNLSVPSNANRSYAPDGKHLISATLRTAEPELNNQRINEIKEELSVLFDSKVFEWKFLKSYYIEKALPVPRSIPSLYWRHPRHTFIAGDWQGTPSIEEAVISGQTAAQKALKYLANNPSPDPELAKIKHILEESVANKELPDRILPNYRSVNDDGSFYMTRDQNGFHLISQERGEETFRESSQSISEFIALVKKNLMRSVS